MSLLILSPHLDDAVLSVGALIAEATSRGEDVHVATFFSGAGTEVAAEACCETRRSEDLRALRVLGAKALHLDLPDAPYRGGAYRSFEQIMFAPMDAEDPLVSDVAARIEELVRDLTPDLVLSPLAVGEHIDHRLVFEAARAMVHPDRIAYYEDLPYALVHGASGLRLAALGRRSSEAPMLELSRFTETWCAAGYVRTFLQPDERAQVLAALQNRAETARKQSCEDIEPEVLVCSSAATDRMFEAIGCYASQVSDLFPPHGNAALAYAESVGTSVQNRARKDAKTPRRPPFATSRLCARLHDRSRSTRGGSVARGAISLRLWSLDVRG